MNHDCRLKERDRERDLPRFGISAVSRTGGDVATESMENLDGRDEVSDVSAGGGGGCA